VVVAADLGLEHTEAAAVVAAVAEYTLILIHLLSAQGFQFK
jgi:hypothetical protein